MILSNTPEIPPLQDLSDCETCYSGETVVKPVEEPVEEQAEKQAEKPVELVEPKKINDLTGSLMNLKISETDEIINENYVNTLFGWLMDVHKRMSSEGQKPDNAREILDMTFDLIKRFLSKNKIEQDKLQLVAIVAWRVVNKLMDDDFYIENLSCHIVCGYSYKKNEFTDMEFKFLNYISYTNSQEIVSEEVFIEKYQNAAKKSAIKLDGLKKMVCVC